MREGGGRWDEFPHKLSLILFNVLCPDARKACGSNKCDCPHTLSSLDIISGNIHNHGAAETLRDLQHWN